MLEKIVLIGKLKKGGYLQIESGDILLTYIPFTTEPGIKRPPLEIALEDIEKMVLVKGNLSEKVLYSAVIVETLSPLTSVLINALISKNIISLDEIQNQVADSELAEEENQDKKKLCALVIGHKKSSPGARNVKADLNEFDFNYDLAMRIEKKVVKAEVQRVFRRTYKELPEDINALNPDYVVSLHCNSYNGKVSGTEMLYYHRSNKGRSIAEILLDNLVQHLELHDRGLLPRTAEDRGGYLLRYTKAPCILAEPFFIDNNDDLARAQVDLDGLASVYANAIDEMSQIV